LIFYANTAINIAPDIAVNKVTDTNNTATQVCSTCANIRIFHCYSNNCHSLAMKPLQIIVQEILFVVRLWLAVSALLHQTIAVSLFAPPIVGKGKGKGKGKVVPMLFLTEHHAMKVY
jgi:hypothetical protein